MRSQRSVPVRFCMSARTSRRPTSPVYFERSPRNGQGALRLRAERRRHRAADAVGCEVQIRIAVQVAKQSALEQTAAESAARGENDFRAAAFAPMQLQFPVL